MSETREAEPLSPRPSQWGPSCPKCQAPSRFTTSILDLKNDRPVQIYRCDRCREEIWN
ncbi:hypothetical protein [Bradyrhizobium sp. Bra64]|uniref:hypothetical protein n=1 Tax=Bradyrhizobium sp. Bra64 TaxID=2926009 RepID=UPI002118F655|nr:hypothetical protein [Bradyrhizobium sp. Bra64]